MVYAQITNRKIVNIIELEDDSLVNLFKTNPNTGSEYDAILQIDNIFPQPGIGWSYINGIFVSPSPALPVYPSPEYFQMIVANAITFGNSLIVQYAAQNVSMGITQAGKTAAVMNYMGQLTLCLSTGSLYEAMNQMGAIIADTSDTKTSLAPFVSNATVYSYLNQVQAYLGITITPYPGP